MDGRQARPFDAESLDRLLHAPPRLAILSKLARTEGGWADFAVLRRDTGLKDSAVSANARLLEEAGLVELGWVEGRRPRRRAVLTEDGRRRLEEHYACIDRLRPPQGDGGGAGDGNRVAAGG